MSPISLKVNGRVYTLELDPKTPLLFALADEIGLRGPKFGCGMAQCGACAVLLDPPVPTVCEATNRPSRQAAFRMRASLVTIVPLPGWVALGTAE